MLSNYLTFKNKKKKNWRGSKTHGRGTKGQKARSGWGGRGLSEGGQTPIYRRLSKKGFSSRSDNHFKIINVGIIDKDISVSNNSSLDFTSGKKKIKILGSGNISKKVFIKCCHFSSSAKEKIEKAGGKIER